MTRSKHATCQHVLELAQALVAQALAEKLGAPTHHPRPESGVTAVSVASSADIGTTGRGGVHGPDAATERRRTRGSA
jgi:hypothetical protein